MLRFFVSLSLVMYMSAGGARPLGNVQDITVKSPWLSRSQSLELEGRLLPVMGVMRLPSGKPVVVAVVENGKALVDHASSFLKNLGDTLEDASALLFFLSYQGGNTPAILVRPDIFEYMPADTKIAVAPTLEQAIVLAEQDLGLNPAMLPRMIVPGNPQAVPLNPRQFIKQRRQRQGRQPVTIRFFGVVSRHAIPEASIPVEYRLPGGAPNHVKIAANVCAAQGSCAHHALQTGASAVATDAQGNYHYFCSRGLRQRSKLIPRK